MITPKNHHEFVLAVEILTASRVELQQFYQDMVRPAEPDDFASDGEWQEFRQDVANFYGRQEGISSAVFLAETNVRNMKELWRRYRESATPTQLTDDYHRQTERDRQKPSPAPLRSPRSNRG